MWRILPMPGQRLPPSSLVPPTYLMEAYCQLSFSVLLQLPPAFAQHSQELQRLRASASSLEQQAPASSPEQQLQLQAPVDEAQGLPANVTLLCNGTTPTGDCGRRSVHHLQQRRPGDGLAALAWGLCSP